MNKKILIAFFFLLAVPLVLAVGVQWNPTGQYKQMCNIADVDDSGRVGIGDLALVKADFGDTDCWKTNDWCDGTDTNMDGHVNSQDLDFVKAFLFKKC